MHRGRGAWLASNFHEVEEAFLAKPALRQVDAPSGGEAQHIVGNLIELPAARVG